MLRTYTFVLLTFLCSITFLSAADYHWVGASGNWSDLNHGATTSGGSTHPQIVPSPFDDVFFDGNPGFMAGSRIVNLNVVHAFCHSMDWTGAMNSPTGNQGTNANLYIYGSLTFIQNMTYQFSGNVRFLSTSGGNTVMTGHQHFSENTWFQGTGGSWSLLDFMSIVEFRLVEGDFYSISLKKMKKPCIVRSLTQFEVIILINTKKIVITSSLVEQIEHGGTSVIILQ